MSGRRAMRMAAAAGWAACVGMIAGCGNSYRPVVATVGAVGPAGQPTKYAVAISTPTPPGATCLTAGPTSNGLMTMVDFSGDTVLVTAELGVNPYYLYLNGPGTVGYTLNCDKTVNTFPLSTALIASQIEESTLPPGTNPVSLLAVGSSEYIADLGVDAIDQLFGTPPALKQSVPITNGTPVYVVGQPNAPRIYALSQASVGGQNLATAIDTSGNTISATLPVGRGPVYGVMTADTRRAFVLNQTDGTVSVINSQTDMLDQFGPSISGFSIAGNVVTFTAQNTLLPGANVTISGLSTGTYLNGQTLTVLGTGLSSTQFEAAFTHANVASTSDLGTAAITNSTISVGVRPVWADIAPGLNELVVLNEGPVFGITNYSIHSNVITFTTAPQNLTAGQPVTLSGFPTSTFLNQQVVTVSATGLTGTSFQASFTHANATGTDAGDGFTGDGTTPGSLSIINIPLCSVTALPSTNCDPNNPIDSSMFGQTVTTVPVGVNPIMVTVLSDYTRAYVANAGIAGLPCSSTGVAVAGVSTTCTVSVVNLQTNTVTATIPINANPASVQGHPVYIASSNSVPAGKVYVVCNDSQQMTVIKTDTDSFYMTIPLQGYGISVRMNAP